MGLLDRIKALPSNPIAMASLGLLSMPTRSRYGVNPMEYAMNGMQMGIQNQQAQQEMEARKQEQLMREQEYKLRVSQYQQEQYQAAVKRAQEAAQREYQQQYLAGRSPEDRMLAHAYPEVFAAQEKEALKPKGFESGVGKRAQDLMKINPSLNPQAAYEQAQREIMSEKQAGAMRVQIGGESKPVLGNAANYVMPDGSAPSPLLTPEQIVGAGGRILTKAELTKQDQAAKLEAKQDSSSVGVGAAIEGYYGAVEKWRKNRTDADAYAEAEQQRRRMAQVLAARRNPGRAPTDADVNLALQDIPNPVSMSQGVGAALGADPFTARMKVIEQELGYNPMDSATIVGGQSSKPSNAVNWEDL